METPAQVILHVGYIEKMSNLIDDVADDLLDIDPGCRDHINDTELKDFSTSILNIGCRAFSIYGDLCTWEASIAEASRELNQAMRTVQHGKDHRQRGAIEIAKSINTCIKLDHDYLEQEVKQHGNYLTAEDHVITKGMEKREPWRKQMEQITKDLSNLVTMVNINNIPCTNIDIRALWNKINTLQDVLPTVIASIEEADRDQGLFSDQLTNPPPLKIPSYSGNRACRQKKKSFKN